MDIDPARETVRVTHRGEPGAGETIMEVVFAGLHHKLTLPDVEMEEKLDTFRACLKLLTEPRFIHSARGGALTIDNVTRESWGNFVSAVESLLSS